MGGELYKAVLERVRLVPNVQIKKEYVIPYPLEIKLPDVTELAGGSVATYHGSTYYTSVGEIIVGFNTRKKKALGFIPWRDEPLARLDDIRDELARVPEIGEPLSHNEHFLVYERDVREREWSPKFDLVVVGIGSFSGQYCGAIQQLDTGRIKSLEIATPFARQLRQAHVNAYGR